MNIRQAEAFRAIMRSGSASRAAEALGITQPAVSRLVSELEKTTGFSLFESNAIAEYLDDTIAPRLHPEDPVLRATNRAWTDYLPIFAETISALESDLTK